MGEEGSGGEGMEWMMRNVEEGDVVKELSEVVSLERSLLWEDDGIAK